MQAPDQVRITFDQNPAAMEALAQAKPGDKGRAELHYSVKSIDAEGAELIVEAIVPPGYEIDEEDDKAPMASDATMTPAAMMVRRQSGA